MSILCKVSIYRFGTWRCHGRDKPHGRFFDLLWTLKAHRGFMGFTKDLLDLLDLLDLRHPKDYWLVMVMSHDILISWILILVQDWFGETPNLTLSKPHRSTAPSSYN